MPDSDYAKQADRVVVVPAKRALNVYLQYSVYICQAHRSFKPCVRLAFYVDNKIDRRVPSILGYVEAITKDEVDKRTDLSDIDRARLRKLIKDLERTGSKTPFDTNEWRENLQVVFLSAPDSPDTLVLPNDIDNNLTSKSSHRRFAFTRNQRYVSLSSIVRNPKYTSDLLEVLTSSQ